MLFVVVGAMLPALFASNAVAGLLIVYDLEWCKSGEFCVEAWKILWTALQTSLIACFAAALSTWMFRAMLAYMRTVVLVAIGLVSSALLFMTLGLALNIKAALAAQFFPYVIERRFGFMGFFIFWGTFSFVVCTVVMAVVVRIDNLTSHWTADAP